MKRAISLFIGLLMLLQTFTVISFADSPQPQISKPVFSIVTDESESTVEDPRPGNLKTKIDVSNAGSGSVCLITALYDRINGTLSQVSSDTQAVSADGSTALSAVMNIASLDGYEFRYYVWDSQALIPYILPEYVPSNLTFSAAAGRIVLSWEIDKLPDNFKEFIVYRDGIEYARTAYLSYTDIDIKEDTTYNYCVSVLTTDGTEYDKSEAVSASAAAVSQYYSFDNPDTSIGLSHYTYREAKWNETTQRYEAETSDSASFRTTHEGRNCRMLTDYYRTKNNNKRTHSFLYFRVDQSKITQSDNNLTFEITYFDSADFGKIWIQYNSTVAEGADPDKTNIAKDSASISSGGTNKWVTKTINVTDAQLRKAADLSGSDFRVTSTPHKQAYISRVAVCKTEDYIPKFTETITGPASVDYDKGISNGLTPITVSTTGPDAYVYQTKMAGRTCMVTGSYYDPNNTSNPRRVKHHYFDVNDAYMFGAANSYAKITFSYYDNGTNDITVQYNAPGGNYYKNVFVTKRTNTNTWKTASIELNDCAFVNGQGDYKGDFRILGGELSTVTSTEEMCQTYISDVSVLREKEFKEAPEDDKIPTIYLAGDSLCADYDSTKTIKVGWGTTIKDNITNGADVVNYAVPGKTTAAFLSNEFETIKTKLVKDDYVLFMFGHNDSMTDSRHVELEDYIANLKTFAAETWKKGANPVFLTPPRLCIFSDGIIENEAIDPYRNAMLVTAGELGVPVIDVGAAHRKFLDSIGEKAAKEYFATAESDTTHFSEKGARVISDIIIDGLSAHPGVRVLKGYITK